LNNFLILLHKICFIRRVWEKLSLTMYKNLNIILLESFNFRREGVNDDSFTSLVMFVLKIDRQMLCIAMCVLYRIMLILLKYIVIHTNNKEFWNKQFPRAKKRCHSYAREWAFNISTTMISQIWVSSTPQCNRYDCITSRCLNISSCYTKK